MLTGDQIAAARRLAGFSSQRDFAAASGVSRPTVERAESARGALPNLRLEQMGKIIRSLEAAGIEFFLMPGSTLVGGVAMRLRPPARP
jgi:transcriptional regulator with XRE-family HTH domain